MQTMVEIKCLHCNTLHMVRQVDVNRGHGKFCSRSCFGKYNTGKERTIKKPNVSCSLCGVFFYKVPSQLTKRSKHGYHFCSRKCKDKAQRIDSGTKFDNMRPDHYKDGRFKYRDIAFRSKPHKCNRCGYDNEPAILVVHHMDRDRSNSSESNLEVLCPTCHCLDHYLARDGRYSKWG